MAHMGKKLSVRFTLKTAVLVLAVLACWLGWATYRAREQKAAVSAIEAVYGRVIYDRASDGHTAPDWLCNLVGTDYWANVVLVDLDNEAVTDETLTGLSRLRSLERLHLSNTRISNDGLANLARLARLKVLTLNTDGIDDSGMTHVGKIASLQDLEIHSAKVTDRGLGRLSGLSRLKRLWLDDTNVTDEGVRRLRASLSNCRIEF